MTSMPRHPVMLPGVPPELMSDPELWAVSLPGETATERAARYAAAADIAADAYGRDCLAAAVARTADIWHVLDVDQLPAVEDQGDGVEEVAA